MSEEKKCKIMLTGGGSGGSVSPLLGIVDALNKKCNTSEYIWIGTKDGPEREMIAGENIRFIPIMYGKLRRYFSWQNFLDLFKIILAFFQAIIIIIKEKPDIVLSAGSYVSVPLAYAAWLLRVPVLIHQLDAKPGLANKMMSVVAKVITVTLEKSLNDYPQNKVELVGSSVRKEFIEVKVTPREARQKLNLNSKMPVVLIMGGGTGADKINQIVDKSIKKLTNFSQILHITGFGKQSITSKATVNTNPNYHAFEFLDTFGMIKSYTAADIVVSRGGMASLTELSYLAKPSILIPMPDTHQEDNTAIFEEYEAAIVLDQKTLDPDIFVDTIKQLVADESKQNEYASRIKNLIKEDGNSNIASIVIDILKKKI